MRRDDLVNVISVKLSPTLARDLVDEFLAIRQDVVTATLGRSSAGKFVETLVQSLQFLESGVFDAKPNVDATLMKFESAASILPDGLRVCAARVGRAMYTLRNKRNIMHKGEVDPNRYDLRLLYASAQWVMAEMLRVTSGLPMAETGRLIDLVQAPVGGLVEEDFAGRRLVLADGATIEDEILILLLHHYPEPLILADMTASIDRRSPGAVRKRIRDMWSAKLVQGDGNTGYRLTSSGFRNANDTVGRYLSSKVS